MEYYFRVRQDGVPKTGLTPDFEYLLTTGGPCGDGSEVGTDKSGDAPTIYEVGGGVYKFDIKFGTAPWDVTTQGLVGVIDADPTGAAGLTDDERYIDIILRNETHALMSMSLDSSGRVDLVDAPNATAVTAIKNAVLGATGVTEGGTYTLAKVLKILAASAAGDWKLKTGTTSTWQIKDPDDGATVVLEMKVAETDPPREVTVSV